MAENPQVCVVDTVLGGEDGYSLVKELAEAEPARPRSSCSRAATRPTIRRAGVSAGADDWADKPFDTQQLIDKVRKVMLGKGSQRPTAAAPASPPPRSVLLVAAPPAFRPPPPRTALARPIAAARDVRPRQGHQPSLSSAVPGRTGTLVSSGRTRRRRRPLACRPRGPPPPPRRRRRPPAAAVAGAVNGAPLRQARRCSALTPQQAEAVLALSRGRRACCLGGRPAARRSDHQGRDRAPHEGSAPLAADLERRVGVSAPERPEGRSAAARTQRRCPLW